MSDEEIGKWAGKYITYRCMYTITAYIVHYTYIGNIRNWWILAEVCSCTWLKSLKYTIWRDDGISSSFNHTSPHLLIHTVRHVAIQFNVYLFQIQFNSILCHQYWVMNNVVKHMNMRLGVLDGDCSMFDANNHNFIISYIFLISSFTAMHVLYHITTYCITLSSFAIVIRLRNIFLMFTMLCMYTVRVRVQVQVHWLYILSISCNNEIFSHCFFSFSYQTLYK